MKPLWGVLAVVAVWVAYLAATAFEPSPPITAFQIEADGGRFHWVLRDKSPRLIEYFIHGFNTTITTSNTTDSQDAGEEVVLVALHGAQTTGKLFSILHQWGESARVKIVAPTLPGFGLTPWTPGLSLAEWVKDVEGLLASLNVTRFHILGTSLGSIYAAALASLYSPRHSVRNIELYVAFGPSATSDQSEGGESHDPLEGSVLKLFADLRSWPLLKQFFERYIVLPLLRSLLPPKSDVVRSIAHQWEGMSHCADVIYQPWDFDWQGLANGRKVVIVSGRNDTAAPPHNQRLLHRKIDGSVLVEYDGAHERGIEEPAMMIEHLQLILKKD